jgi:hypothetical protein
VQCCKDDFNAANALLRMDIHWHAAAIIGGSYGAIFMQDYLNEVGVTGQGLVDAVIDNFLCKVVGTRGVGVHSGALAHRLEPREDLDIFGGIFTHSCGFLPVMRVMIQGMGSFGSALFPADYSALLQA